LLLKGLHLHLEDWVVHGSIHKSVLFLRFLVLLILLVKHHPSRKHSLASRGVLRTGNLLSVGSEQGLLIFLFLILPFGLNLSHLLAVFSNEALLFGSIIGDAVRNDGSLSVIAEVLSDESGVNAFGLRLLLRVQDGSDGLFIGVGADCITALDGSSRCDHASEINRLFLRDLRSSDWFRCLCWLGLVFLDLFLDPLREALLDLRFHRLVKGSLDLLLRCLEGLLGLERLHDLE